MRKARYILVVVQSPFQRQTAQMLRERGSERSLWRQLRAFGRGSRLGRLAAVKTVKPRLALNAAVA